MERRLQLEPRLPAPAFVAHLRGLAQAQAVALDGAWVRLPHHSVKLTSGDERAWAHVWPLLAGDCRFRPPRVRDVAALLSASEADVRRLMKLTSAEAAGRNDRLEFSEVEVADRLQRLGGGAVL